MENQLTELDLMIIRKEITRKSNADIAFLLDRSLEETTDLVNDLAKDLGVISFQQVLDEKKKELQKLRPQMELKERKPKKEHLVISRKVVQPSTPKREPRRYKTKVVDYSELRTLRIDHKTIIYLKPGQDPETTRIEYLSRLKEHRSNMLTIDKTQDL